MCAVRESAPRARGGVRSAAGGQASRQLERAPAAVPDQTLEPTGRACAQTPPTTRRRLIDAAPPPNTRWTPEDKALATRQSSQVVLNKLAEGIPELVGGSADLTPSNLTKPKGAEDFQAATPEGRYVRFGVREHAMAAICNGLASYAATRGTRAPTPRLAVQGAPRAPAAGTAPSCRSAARSSTSRGTRSGQSVYPRCRGGA